MNRAAEAASEITEEFGFLDDWEDRYQLLIDQGRRLAPHLQHDAIRGARAAEAGDGDAPAAAVGGAAAPASGIDKSKLSLLRRKLARKKSGASRAT